MTEVKGLWQTTSREWDELITYSEVRLLLRHTAAPLWADSLNLIWLGPGLCWNCLIAELIIRLSQKPSSQLNCIVTSRHKLTLRTCCLPANCANCWAFKHFKYIKMETLFVLPSSEHSLLCNGLVTTQSVFHVAMWLYRPHNHRAQISNRSAGLARQLFLSFCCSTTSA